MVGTYIVNYMVASWYQLVWAMFGTFWAWPEAKSWKLSFLFWGKDCFHRGLGGSIGVIYFFTQVSGYIYGCVMVPKIQTLSNLDEKGWSKLPRIRVTHIAPNFLTPKYPKIPNPGTSYLPGVVLNEFSLWARSNFLVWCRIRPRKAKFMFLGNFGSILGQIRGKFGHPEWCLEPSQVSCSG